MRKDQRRRLQYQDKQRLSAQAVNLHRLNQGSFPVLPSKGELQSMTSRFVK